jgi:hypothetical protein
MPSLAILTFQIVLSLTVNAVFLCPDGVIASETAGLSSKSGPTGKLSRATGAIDSLVVEVNGERRRVDPTAGFSIVRGDLLTIVDVALKDRSASLPLVDVIGFRAKSTKSKDDRGLVIDTARNLNRIGSLDGQGRRYPIRVSSANGLRGEVIMTIEEPRLISLEIEVNGEHRTFTPGDRLSIAASDSIHILDLRTNIRGNENVKYEISNNKPSTNRSKKELRFSRDGRVFARVPIEWRGS